MRIHRKNNHQLSELNRGQAMILIALAFIGLVAFIGLAIDAGIVFAHVGHLRRGVDAAALSAANQIRQGWSIGSVTSSAQELILLNLPADSASDLQVVVQTCSDTPSIQGCSGPINRKLAKVSAEISVNLAFLPIIGWDSVPIGSNAISEAASVDLILVIDNSTSMAYDAPEGDPMRIPANCNPINACQPFEKVRSAAKVLVNNMFEGFDQIGLVTFNRFAGQTANYPDAPLNEFPLDIADHGLTTDFNSIRTALDNMRVYMNLPTATCNDAHGGDFRGCMRTNTAAGLRLAGMTLAAGRPESVKVVVLLSDGLANAAYEDPFELNNPDKWYCPNEYWMDPVTYRRVGDDYEGPWCTDGDPSIGYVNPKYGDGTIRDPDDAARALADWVACLPGGENEHCASNNGVGAVIFVIGLGDGLVSLDYAAPVDDVGGQLLRYVARVGYSGDPRASTDPCGAVANDVTKTCGNYYFAPTGDDLNQIFRDIADRIFTRLTH
jgi:hypothetical protein